MKEGFPFSGSGDSAYVKELKQVFPRQPLTEECFQSNQTPDKIVKIDDEVVVCKASNDDLVELTGHLET